MAVIAPSLARLRSELNQRWPNRDRSTDGWIGNAAHAATGSPESGGSDHNPNKRGVVDAIDIDKDGIDTMLVVAMAIKHPAVNYVIWNRKIWSRSRNFASHAYTGKDPHTNHIHVSLLQTVAAENSTKAWGIFTGTVATPISTPTEPSWAARLAASMPLLKLGPQVRGSVRKAQALLTVTGHPVDTDGIYGPRTAAAARAFQHANKLAEDAIIGPKTWAKLLGPMPTLKTGASGTAVKQVQALLKTVGYTTLAVDGVYGPKTTDSVRAFQARFGLERDGICGPITWTALLTR